MIKCFDAESRVTISASSVASLRRQLYGLVSLFLEVKACSTGPCSHSIPILRLIRGLVSRKSSMRTKSISEGHPNRFNHAVSAE